MREIKFRVWCPDGMLKVTDIEWDRDGHPEGSLSVMARKDKNDWTKIIDFWPNEDNGCRLMQYTGLKDSEGKEIYEGDIVRWIPIGDKGAVEYSEGCFYAIDGDGDRMCLFGLAARSKIIGNVYENPELLEGYDG